MSDYSNLSLWLATYPGDLLPRPALDGDTEVDAAIVGGGFTGLWTAYYLAERDPSLSILVIEREICGFGASGRNGGWCVGELVAGVGSYARIAGQDAALRLLRHVHRSVDEVGRVVSTEGIDCGFAKGGVVRFARNRAQARRQQAEIDQHRSYGIGEEVIRLLSPEQVREYANPTDLHGGIFYEPCAALDPARLVRGLAEAVERRGVRIVEQTTATSLERGRVTTSRGLVKAPVVIRALEAYTRDLPGQRRSLVPLYSLMIATEPLDRATLAEIGLASRPTFADDRYAVIYGQRTADDRIAFGGRAVPYRYGSRISPATERDRRSHDLIRRVLVEIFPVLDGVQITHRWGGVLGAPRNWMPSVRFDRDRGFGTAGGYVGEGVAPSNLAGRTLADLVTGAGSELASLPWVGVESRFWEPEPIRWLGIRGTRAVMGWADRKEFRTGRRSWAGETAYQLLRR
ncbi:MAG: FAD-binding oxidoreductase [bacterium]|nr:FAD-binding oxidoreductase [bacterium]MDE0288471.1 FAD-binding oxidoreductase [bacterium]MDE0439335.1 FAD-binding oxidoreductase [bacterium]